MINRLDYPSRPPKIAQPEGANGYMATYAGSQWCKIIGTRPRVVPNEMSAGTDFHSVTEFEVLTYRAAKRAWSKGKRWSMAVTPLANYRGQPSVKRK